MRLRNGIGLQADTPPHPPQCEHCKGRTTPQGAGQSRRHSQFVLSGYLVARFANCFDLKDWEGLGHCLGDELYTDYSDLRGTPPETMSREKFVELRRIALHDLQTHHLTGNLEIEADETTANLKVSMAIHRRNQAGEKLNTHCLYFLGAEHADSGWVINSLVQKVFISDGRTGIHKGVIKS
jgi:hypothetical protein